MPAVVVEKTKNIANIVNELVCDASSLTKKLNNIAPIVAPPPPPTAFLPLKFETALTLLVLCSTGENCDPDRSRSVAVLSPQITYSTLETCISVAFMHCRWHFNHHVQFIQ